VLQMLARIRNIGNMEMVVTSRRRLVEVGDDLWARVRQVAFREGRPVKAVVSNALRLYCVDVSRGVRHLDGLEGVREAERVKEDV
jgi:hypothetical protein